MIRRSLVVLMLAGLASPAVSQVAAPPATPAPGGEAAPAPGQAPALPPLPAHLQGTPAPKSLPPGIALASWNNGQVYLRVVLPFPKPTTPNTPAPAPGAANAPGSELASVAQPFASQQVQARTVDGKPVSSEELAQRLARETPVLVGFIQDPPDPTYLQVAKGESLVILLPTPEPAGPGAPGAAPGPAPTPAGAPAAPEAGPGGL